MTVSVALEDAASLDLPALARDIDGVRGYELGLPSFVQLSRTMVVGFGQPRVLIVARSSFSCHT